MALTDPGVTRGIPSLDTVRDYIANSAVLWEYAGCKPHSPSVEFVARGAANAVFRFTAGEKTLALRASIAANTHSSHETQVTREYDVLRCLENHQIAPQPVILDVDENQLGTPLIIMEYLSGPTLTYSGPTLTPADSSSPSGPLNRQNLSWQISKEFLTYLTDQGFW